MQLLWPQGTRRTGANSTPAYTLPCVRHHLLLLRSTKSHLVYVLAINRALCLNSWTPCPRGHSTIKPGTHTPNGGARSDPHPSPSSTSGSPLTRRTSDAEGSSGSTHRHSTTLQISGPAGQTSDHTSPRGPPDGTTLPRTLYKQAHASFGKWPDSGDRRGSPPQDLRNSPTEPRDPTSLG